MASPDGYHQFDWSDTRRSEAKNGTRSVLGVADGYAVTNGGLDAAGEGS